MNLDKIFHLKENHTDVKTEVMAGITTFMTMAYILAVNPNILSASGMDRGAVFTATALSAFIATCLLPCISHTEDYCVGEVCVQAHAGSKNFLNLLLPAMDLYLQSRLWRSL